MTDIFFYSIYKRIVIQNIDISIYVWPVLKTSMVIVARTAISTEVFRGFVPAHGTDICGTGGVFSRIFSADYVNI